MRFWNARGTTTTRATVVRASFLSDSREQKTGERCDRALRDALVERRCAAVEAAAVETAKREACEECDDVRSLLAAAKSELEELRARDRARETADAERVSRDTTREAILTTIQAKDREESRVAPRPHV